MPNPRAQRQLTLDRVVSDLKSFAEPAQAMGDMMAGALRGSVAATSGVGGDIRELVDLFGADAVEKVLGKRVMPTTEEMKKILPSAVPQDASASRKHTAEMFGSLGEFAPTPMTGTAAKALSYGLGRGAGALTRGAGKAINDAMVYNQGPLAQGSLSFLAPRTATMNVVKPEGGNWTGGDLMNSVDRSLKRLTTPTVAGQTPAERIPLHERALLDQAINDDGRAIIQRHLDTTKGEAALDKWVTQNLGNYVKKQMATPNDPVRLMFEKRVQEVESKFSKDMERVNRTRERAQQEADPRRQANLMREADRLELDAQAGKDLAMKHITHLPANDVEESAIYVSDRDMRGQRERAGFNPEGEAKSMPAKAWENLSDEAIQTRRAGDIQEALGIMPKAQELTGQLLQKEVEIDQKFRKYLEDKNVLTPDQLESVMDKMSTLDKAHLIGEGEEFGQLRAKQAALQGRLSGNDFVTGEQNPWISKLDPEAPLYSGDIYNLGFDHVVDVLKQDVREGRIRPDQLNKVSVEQAIKRTAEFDMEQAKKMAETAIKQQEGFPTHKEYPEGYKWIELTSPKKDLPSDWSVKEALNPISGKQFQVFDETGAPIAGAYGKTEESAISSATKQLGRPELESALKYEGDTMGHCVGGYCPDVLEGRTRIFSLRDPRGEPHVTVEVRPNQARSKYETDWLMSQPEDVQDKITKQALAEHEATKATRTPEEDRFTWGQALSNAIKSHMGEVPDQIIQIKGKQNRAPKEEYLPYVQDFVRGGNWSDVGDLRNTGLMDVQNFLNPTTREKYLEHKLDIPKYATEAELDKLHNEYLRLAEPNNYIPPETGMKKGGKVSISDNCDCQHMEVMDKHMAGGGALSKAAIEALERMKALKPEFQARTNLLNKYKAETASIPYNEVKPFQMTNEQIREEMDRMAREQAEREQSKAKGGAVEKLIKLARAPAKSKAEIEAIAQRIAPQMTGEYVRASDKTAKTVAGKTQKQFEREKTLEHDIRPTEGVDRPPVNPVDIESLKGNVMMGISGDPTISGQTIYSVAGVPLRSPTPQHGGPLYGLGKDDEFWASNLSAAQGVQNRAKGLSELYDSPVVGNYVKMGPDSYSFAQHFADTNMQNIHPELMTKKQIEGFNKLVRQGSLKSGPRPSFPGIEHPEEAYLHFAVDPELRKHFGNLMQMPTVTEKFGLPSGLDVAHAVTEPDLRNLEIGVTGKSLGLMKPDVTDLKLSAHPTYSHDIPGQFLGGLKYPVPHDLMFPDTLKSVRENPAQAPQEFGSFKMVGPRQLIDQQMIDEISQYQDMIKKLTGKKKGGKVKKMAEGGAITGDDLIIEERPL